MLKTGFSGMQVKSDDSSLPQVATTLVMVRTPFYGMTLGFPCGGIIGCYDPRESYDLLLGTDVKVEIFICNGQWTLPSISLISYHSSLYGLVQRQGYNQALCT